MSTNLNLSGTNLSRTAALDSIQRETEDRSRETRRIYDIVAGLYPLSSRLFHSRAHKAALTAAQIQDGETVLEVATGSGEMLRQLAEPNASGQTIGVDLSPNMAARSQQTTRKRYPASRVDCQAADVRFLPFADRSFDVIVCCYLFELLPEQELGASLQELSRVLKPGGRLVTVLVAQNKRSFNAMYKVCNKVAPAFWGQQMEQRVVKLLSRSGYQLSFDQHIRQIYYSSRVISAQRA